MKLFDREENYIGNLKYTLVANHYEEINGEDILEFTTLDNRIEKGYRVLYKDIYGIWHEFIIKGIDEEKRDDGVIKYVYCESSFYETFGDYIGDKRPSGQASIALMVALEPTRWEVGIVDNLGDSRTNFYRISAKEAVQKVAQAWQGEIRTRVVISGNKITRRYVDILARRGNDLGKRFTYTKDIESIKKTIHREDVITALYGYGKGEEIEDTGGYGRRIDFADINNGKAYVENNDARLIWGRNNPDGTRSHVFSKVEFDECEDRHELLLLTLEKLEEISSPLVTYEAKVIDLKAYGLEHEGVELGDTVAIIDKDFEPELRLKARVVGINRDILEPENNEIILGNFIPSIIDSSLEDKIFIDNFRNKQGIWDRSNVINQDGSINANILNDLVNELNTRMNSQGGYVYISDDGKGLTTYDKPVDQDPTMAIQILGGAFRIAGSKLPNGEWDWRTFGTGEGFVADFITTGTLDARLIKAGVFSSHDNSTWINMVNGEFNLKDKIKFIDDVLSITLNDSDLEQTLDALILTNDSFRTRIQSIEANMNFEFMQDTAPLDPEIGDIWFSTSSEVFIVNNLLMTVDQMTETVEYYGNSLNKSYRWDGSKWQWIEDGAITELRQSVSEVKQTNQEISSKVQSTELDVNNLTTRVSTAEQKITPQAITNTVEARTTTLAKKSEIPDISGKADKSEIPDITNLATKSEVTQTADNVRLEFTTLKTKNGADATIQSGVTRVNKDGIRVTHSGTNQYSEVTANGFKRNWGNGESAYLNDIWMETFYFAGTPGNSRPASIKVVLPNRFRNRGSSVKILLTISEMRLIIGTWGGSSGRDIVSMTTDIDTVLRVVSSNFSLTAPEIIVDSYFTQRYENGNGTRYRDYGLLGFTIAVIGE